MIGWIWNGILSICFIVLYPCFFCVLVLFPFIVSLFIVRSFFCCLVPFCPFCQHRYLLAFGKFSYCSRETFTNIPCASILDFKSVDDARLTCLKKNEYNLLFKNFQFLLLTFQKLSPYRFSCHSQMLDRSLYSVPVIQTTPSSSKYATQQQDVHRHTQMNKAIVK